MDLTKFDNIRPYNDSEVHPALERIVANPLLVNIANYIFPGGDPEMFKKPHEIRQLMSKLQDARNMQQMQQGQVMASEANRNNAAAENYRNQYQQ